MNDGQLDSGSVTVSITVTAVNDPPTAVNDAYSVNQDAVLTVNAPGVLWNDADIDSIAITAVQAVAPAHGTVNLAADGSFVYTPVSGYTGTDSFTYQAYDGAAYSSVATVSITVQAVNHAPTANAQSVTTAEDTPKAITLAGSDPDGNPALLQCDHRPDARRALGHGPGVDLHAGGEL